MPTLAVGIPTGFAASGPQTLNFKQFMRWLLTLSRLAFICNLFFLIAFSFQLSNWIKNEQITSTVVLIGYVMGFILNPLANFSYLVFGIVSRKSLKILPSWLIVANVLFLVIDAFYILYINSHK
jgi:hypothetical protein